jgi:hypothetical protein
MLVVQVSGDLAFVGLFLGAWIGWKVTGRSDRDAMRDGSDNNAGWVDDTTP